MDEHFYENFSLEDMASCDKEAEKFADFLEKRGLYSAPANLKDAILKENSRTEHKLFFKTFGLSEKAQLFRYGLKVSLAAACSIGMVITMPLSHFRSPSQPVYTDSPVYVEVYKKLQNLTEKIGEFSQSLYDMEALFYDK